MPPDGAGSSESAAKNNPVRPCRSSPAFDFPPPRGGDSEFFPHFHRSPDKLLGHAFVLAADSGLGNFGAIP
jgi:hypothetical protein